MKRSYPAQSKRRIVLAAVAMVTISGVVNAGDDTDKSLVPNEAPAKVTVKTVPWWSIPRSARDAVKSLAATRDASVTRCTVTESGNTMTYDFHAARRKGLFRKKEFVLTSATEPTSVAKKRQEEQSLKRRFERFRNGNSPKPANEPTERTSFLDPNSK